MPSAKLCASLRDDSATFSMLQLWTSITFTVNISHWCLLTSWAFTDSWLVCLPSWVGSLLSTGSTSGRNWCGTVITIGGGGGGGRGQFSALSFMTCRATKCHWSCIQMHSGKLVVQLETDGMNYHWRHLMSPHPGLSSFNCSGAGLLHSCWMPFSWMSDWIHKLFKNKKGALKYTTTKNLKWCT